MAMDLQVYNLIKHIDEIKHPVFLLVQGDVLGVSKTPLQLPFRDLDFSRKWKVLVGTINEFGNHEIVGKAAEVYPHADKTCWRISSPMDGDFRLIGSTGTMANLIYNRLQVLFKNGDYDDVCNLPQTIILSSCNSR